VTFFLWFFFCLDLFGSEQTKKEILKIDISQDLTFYFKNNHP